MKKDQDDITRPASQPLPGFDSGPARDPEHNEPRYLDFDQDDNWEEPERDRDVAPGFRQESIDEEAFETLLPEELEAEDNSALFEEQEDFLRSTGADGSSPSYFSAGVQREEPVEVEPFTAQRRDDALDDDEALYDDEDDWVEEDTIGACDDDDDWSDEFDSPAGGAAAAQQWQDEDDYADDGERGGWPVGLIAVAVLAVVLLAAGGYGVMEQRAQTEDEIQTLRAALATAASPGEVAESRESLQAARESIARLQGEAGQLAEENRRLVDTVAGLEAQLTAVEAELAAATRAAESARAAPPAPAPSKAPEQAAPAKPAAAPATVGGPWFVNFGSYGDRALAQDWAGKLQPGAGQVIVAEGARDGRTFYRVRVVGLADRPAAESVARTLEQRYELPKLWVGRQ